MIKEELITYVGFSEFPAWKTWTSEKLNIENTNLKHFVMVSFSLPPFHADNKMQKFMLLHTTLPILEETFSEKRIFSEPKNESIPSSENLATDSDSPTSIYLRQPL